MHKLFEKLKVLDLSTVLAGPSVATFFAELGAEVIKIEPPGSGDVTRSWKLPSEDPNDPISAYFSSVNFKKKVFNTRLT
jgi:crotonobetainyl-CoA:carnitine CoA-transferase CaiB-like acyl-CoA transferase